MAVNISNALALTGHIVILCVSRESGSLIKTINDSVKIEYLKKKYSFDFFSFLRLVKLVKKNKIEVIHAHSTSIYWSALVKLLFPSKILVWHDHFGGRTNDRFHNINYKIISFLFDGVIAVSEEIAIWSRQNLLKKNLKVVLIKNFPMLFLNSKNRNFGKIQIVLLANFRPEKDHLTLVKAIDYIAKNVDTKNVNVIFAGNYNKNDPYYLSVKNEIDSLSLNHIINIVGEVENISDLLFSSNIGVICSLFEGLPVSILEYGLAGLAVISTNVGECGTVLQEGEFGHVVSKGDVKGLADSLLYYIENPSIRDTIGVKLREHVVKNYGYENFIINYQLLISSLRKT